MQTQGVVIDSVANLYSEPNTDVELVTQAIVGTSVTILDRPADRRAAPHGSEEAGWHYVRLPDGYPGWIEARRLRLYASGEPAYASTGPVAEIASLLAFLYHRPAVSARAPALQVTLGARLEVAGEAENWYQVVLPGGSMCWVQRGDVVFPAPDLPHPRGSADAVVGTALRFLGLPYLWGGTTPLGLDCSGLVQIAYRLHGVELLRDSSLQYTQPGLVPVAREALQTGDLIFFGQERITHVGLYLGEGEFIHATTHERPVVQISHLAEPHWTERYQGARRP